MNIDITAIERYLRLFALPVFLMFIGFMGMMLFSGPAPASGLASALLANVGRVFFPASAALTLVASIWTAWNCWQLFRWERGDLQGGCNRCGGVMTHTDGRYGTYSVCKMCGGSVRDGIEHRVKLGGSTTRHWGF